jgi:hypothetical protein
LSPNTMRQRLKRFGIKSYVLAKKHHPVYQAYYSHSPGLHHSNEKQCNAWEI